LKADVSHNFYARPNDFTATSAKRRVDFIISALALTVFVIQIGAWTWKKLSTSTVRLAVLLKKICQSYRNEHIK